MADKDLNSAKESAYIAELLSKLRATIGQTEAQPGGTSGEPTDEGTGVEIPKTELSPEVPSSPNASALTESQPEEQDPMPAGEGSAPDEESPSAVSLPDGASSAEEAPDKAEPTPAAPLSSAKASESRKKSKQKLSVTSDTPAPEMPTDASSQGNGVLQDNAEHSGSTSYAHTVLPGDPRFSGRNTAGRYLDFDLADPSAAESVSEETRGIAPSFAPDGIPEKEATDLSSDAPDSSGEPVSDASSVFAPHVPAVAGGTEEIPLPVPDAPMERDTAMPVPDADPDAFSAPSIWDTLPPIPASPSPATTPQEDASVLSAGSPDEKAPPAASDFPRHIGNKTRRSWSDIDFTAASENGVLVDKILEPSQDLAEEGDASLVRQTVLWKQELRKKRSGMRFRTIAAGACLLFAVLFELIPAISSTVLDRLLLTRVPGAAHLIDLQILLLAALFGIGQIFRGFEAVRFRRVIPETLVSFSFLVTLGGSIYLTVTDFAGLYFCALPAVLIIFISLLSECFRLRSLHHAFESYTAKGHHFCAVYSDVTEHPLLGSQFADATNRNLFETASVSRIDGFIDAARRRVECRRASWIALSVAAAAALLSLAISLIASDGALAAVWGIVLSFAGVMPLALFGVHRFLFSMLSSRASQERVGISGEETVFRDAHTGVMTFEDTEAFPAGSVQLSGIKLCGDFRLDKALYLTASVFDAVGGPLNGVFRVSTSDINISDNVEIRELFDIGIDARVNHDDVLIGTKAFLESRGVSVFRDVEDDRAEQGRTRVLYLSYMGCLSAKFHVSYEMSDTFESNVEYYAKHGIASAILTADPLLDRAFLDRVSYISEYDVRVVKKTKDALCEEEPKPHEATLITYGPRKTLRRMPFFFGTYGKYQSIVVGIMMVFTALCGVAMPFLLHFLPGAVPWLPLVVQVAGLIPCVVFGLLIQRLNPNK